VFRSRLGKSREFLSPRKWFWRWVRTKKAFSNPYLLLATSFLAAIVVGAQLLATPWATTAGRLSRTDSWFAATSAVCVTGLTVKSTGQDFTFWGQLVILVLIQFGGIGFMTLSTMVFLGLRQRASLYEQSYLRDYYGADTSQNLPAMTRRVVSYIAWFEACAAALLFVRFALDKPQSLGWLAHLGRSLWAAIFHSISAFCNAGFSLWDDSLVRYSGDWLVNGVIMALIVGGGLGFFVLADLHAAVVAWRQGARARLRFQTRVILSLTVLLIVCGALLLGGLECANPETLAGRPWHGRILPCLFQSVTARTAGFNTVDLNKLAPASLLLIMALMFIGAAPGGTGGGVKVTTFGVLVAQVLWVFRPHREPTVMGRKPRDGLLIKQPFLLRGWLLSLAANFLQS